MNLRFECFCIILKIAQSKSPMRKINCYMFILKGLKWRLLMNVTFEVRVLLCTCRYYNCMTSMESWDVGG